MVRPTDVETFRVQLEAAGCDVEGALAAAAAAQQQAEEAARQTANGRQRSPAKSSSSSSSSAKGGSEKEAAAGRRPAAGRSMSAHSGHSSTASVPTTNWAALGASYMSSGGSAAFEVAPAGSLGALSHARSSGSSGNGAAAATVEDEEAESAGLAAGSRGAAVPDFAVYVGETKELHRVSWDHGVTVRVKGERALEGLGMVAPVRLDQGCTCSCCTCVFSSSVCAKFPRLLGAFCGPYLGVQLIPCNPRPAPCQAGMPRWSRCPPSAATSLAALLLLDWNLRPSVWPTCSTAAARCRRCTPSAWRRPATPARASWVRF